MSRGVDGKLFSFRCIIFWGQASGDTCLPKTLINGDHQASICWRFFTLSNHINSCSLSICQPSVIRQCTLQGGVLAAVLWFWGVKPHHHPPPSPTTPTVSTWSPRTAVTEDGLRARLCSDDCLFLRCNRNNPIKWRIAFHTDYWASVSPAGGGRDGVCYSWNTHMCEGWPVYGPAGNHACTHAHTH